MKLLHVSGRRFVFRCVSLGCFFLFVGVCSVLIFKCFLQRYCVIFVVVYEV